MPLREWDSEAAEAASQLKQLWRSCPMRGRRLLELACGGFHDVMRSLLDKRFATLLVSFPQGVSRAQRASLSREFELGRFICSSS